ncbi:BAG family molecular chaperone regulator 2-like isoform X2 [Mangifera indica]|uniref:BAG family molecular chaperone regulator 2-like isoform X2 n=1 Tax=Mangifera indica TaxID=29780 RepID=UPI001CFB8670|nr:BAG family molecular chaperone regulator 2-like isoform X2 [Mangifera indica]
MLSFPRKKSSGGTGKVGMNVEEWEIRPGGMLVQKRNLDSNQSVTVPTIKVRVKFGSTYHEVCANSIASFGELKKTLAEHTGLHHQDQKLIYKKKVRDSKEYLDVAGVKNGSRMVLVEDIASRERRCLEMIRNANIEKASKLLSQIRLQVDKFAERVTVLEASACRGDRITDKDFDNLIGMLMTELVKLDEISIEGDLKLQKSVQERRVQKYIEILDILKLNNSKLGSKAGKIPPQQKDNIPKPLQKHKVQLKQKNLTEQRPVQQQQPMAYTPSVVVTTKWETFD